MKPHDLLNLFFGITVATIAAFVQYSATKSDEWWHQAIEKFDNFFNGACLFCCKIMLLISAFFIVCGLISNEFSIRFLCSLIPFFVYALVFYLLSSPFKRNQISL